MLDLIFKLICAIIIRVPSAATVTAAVLENLKYYESSPVRRPLTRKAEIFVYHPLHPVVQVEDSVTYAIGAARESGSNKEGTMESSKAAIRVMIYTATTLF